MSMDYEPLEVIGHGSFGQIRKVRRIQDGEVFVRKEVSYKTMNAKERTQLIAEFRILKSLNHPNIVKYLHHEHVPDSHEVHLYMEYCSGGDLSSKIRKLAAAGTLCPEQDVWSIFVQLLQALYRCHYNKVPPAASFGGTPLSDGPEPQSFILHRDIKPENVFMGSDTNIKLGDFGLAKLLDHDNPLAQTYVGTPYYMSPEVLLDRPSTPASDIWSLGCVMYELCTLHPPFRAKSHLQLSQRIREGAFSPISTSYSSALSKTITACLNVNPALRPTTATLLNLDVVKVHRKELELAEHARFLELKQESLENDQQNYRRFLEQQLYERLERDLEPLIEDEVNRRVDDRLRQIQIPAAQQAASRQVRGPRSIQDTILSPLRSSTLGRMPLDDMSNQRAFKRAY